MSSLNSVNKDVDRLYNLLPTIHRQRDAEQGFPLQALLRVITEQVVVVEEDIAQLYENWFIETCQDWVVSYIGDLLGYRVVHEAGEPGDVLTIEERLRNKILIPRRDVANTIHDRRRKGTLKLLEELARDVAGWPARAVEFYTLLGWFQNINALHLERGRTLDLRNGDTLDRLDGPFDESAHTVDVRRIISQRSVGRYNIPSVGLFVWRLKVYSVTNTRARLLEEAGPEFFTFSILGNDTQLYTKPTPKADSQRTTDELNFPTPIRRRIFKDRVNDYYGVDNSLYIWAGVIQPPEVSQQSTSAQPSKRTRSRQSRASQQAGGEQQSRSPQQHGDGQQAHIVWEPVDPARIVAADLSDWQYHPRGTDVAVDPVLGRIAFSPHYIPPGGVRVLYHYGFSADIGGGEYNRPLFQPANYQLFRVSKKEGGIRSIKQALDQWEDWKETYPDQPQNAVIEITDSAAYSEDRLHVSLGEKESLQIRAANRKRPVIRLFDRRPDRTDALELTGASNVTGTSGSRFTLDGLLITGRGVRIEGELAEVTIRHCTLVPGWEIDEDCEPQWENEPSLELVNTDAVVTIEHSILGSIRVDENEVTDNPIRIHISDSILDATSTKRIALGGVDAPVAHASLTIVRSTVFGRIRVHSIELAENSIFNSVVRVARSQVGCVRFCYVPEGSRTPRRYNCQPDLVEQAVDEAEATEIRTVEEQADEAMESKTVEEQEIKAEKQRESDRVVPIFNSTRYGTPTYCQLADACAEEIKRGADDESEMGVFHDLFQPQRAANLRARLDEFTPAGNEAGIIYAS